MTETNEKQTAEKTVLDNVLVVHVDTDIWTGQKILRQSDLPEGYRLYEGKGVRSGSKCLVDPAKLSAINALSSETERYLESKGVRFCRGWAVPASESREVRSVIKGFEDRFKELKLEFLRGFSAYTEEWCRENPDIAPAIREAVGNITDLADRFAFKALFFRLSGLTEVSSDEEIEDARMVEEGLRNTLFVDAAARCAYLSNRFASARPYANVVLRRHLLKLGGKLNGLKFLNPKFERVVKLIDGLVGRFDASDHAVGEDFIFVAAALRMLSTGENLGKFLDGKAAPEDFIDEVKPGIDAAVQRWAEEQAKAGRSAVLVKRSRKTKKTAAAPAAIPDVELTGFSEACSAAGIPEAKQVCEPDEPDGREAAAGMPVIEAAAPDGMTADERADFIVGLAESLASSETALAVVNEAQEKLPASVSVKNTRRSRVRPETRAPKSAPTTDDPFADLGFF